MAASTMAEFDIDATTCSPLPQVIADTAGVDVSQVTLSVTAGSVVIRADIETPDASAALAAKSNIETTFSTPQAASTALAAAAVVVTSTPLVQTATEDLVAYPPPLPAMPPTPPPLLPPVPPLSPLPGSDDVPLGVVAIVMAALGGCLLIVAIGTGLAKATRMYKQTTIGGKQINAAVANPIGKGRIQSAVEVTQNI